MTGASSSPCSLFWSRRLSHVNGLSRDLASIAAAAGCLSAQGRVALPRRPCALAVESDLCCISRVMAKLFVSVMWGRVSNPPCSNKHGRRLRKWHAGTATSVRWTAWAQRASAPWPTLPDPQRALRQLLRLDMIAGFGMIVLAGLREAAVANTLRAGLGRPCYLRCSRSASSDPSLNPVAAISSRSGRPAKKEQSRFPWSCVEYTIRGVRAKGISMRPGLCIAAVFALALASFAQPAMAKGCLKGAVVGGAAGHYAGHHGVLGAAAGCLIGRHEARKHARERGGS
jgi:hypothetical protein